MDSIVQPCPDSVLALLQAFEPAALSGNSADNRAYADMLAAQARYTAHIVPKADDTVAIDKAVERFDGTPLEARALVFSGTTRESLGDILEAMRRYKDAEMAATAAEDTFQTAYARMRMGWLYHSNFATPQAIDKYKLALWGFRQTGDLPRQLSMLSMIGGLYRGIDVDSCHAYFSLADDLSLRMGDSVSHYNIVMRRAELHYVTDSIAQAVGEAEDVLAHIGSGQLRYTAMAVACCGYIKQGRREVSRALLDSLRPVSDEDSMWWYRAHAEYRQAFEGGRDYACYGDKAALIADTIVNRKYAVALMAAERGAVENQLQTESSRRKTWLLLVGLAVALVLMTGGYWFWRISRRNRAHEEEIARLSGELESSNRAMELSQEQFDAQIQSMLSTLSEKIEQLDHASELLKTGKEKIARLQADKRGLSTNINSAVEMLNMALNSLKGLFEKKLPRENQAIATLFEDDRVFSLLVNYVEQNRIPLPASRQELESKLTAQEVRVVYLHKCGFSNYVIAAYLGYSNEHSVPQKKKEIVRKLFGKGASIDLLK